MNGRADLDELTDNAASVVVSEDGIGIDAPHNRTGAMGDFGSVTANNPGATDDANLAVDEDVTSSLRDLQQETESDVSVVFSFLLYVCIVRWPFAVGRPSGLVWPYAILSHS